MTFGLLWAADSRISERSIPVERSELTATHVRLDVTCPKCASEAARSIEEIYESRTTPHDERKQASAHLSRQSSPPGKRYPEFWLALAVVSGVAGLLEVALRNIDSAGLFLCAVLALLMARDASRYNETDFPRLLQYWHRAFMCERCGEIYVPAGMGHLIRVQTIVDKR